MIAVVLCLTLVLGVLAACNTHDNTALAKVTDVYGMGAVSTVKLLGSAMPAKALRRMSDASRTASEAAEQSGTDVQAQAEKFNEYFTALDSFLGEDIVTTTTEANTDENYPYETKLTIKGKDFDGNTVKYVMYYTETLVAAETDLDDDDDEDKDEQESFYTLKGVMTVDGKYYTLEGVRAFEQEGNETENELAIRAYADKTNAPGNYVEMVQESSVEDNETETEYVYSVYSNGQLIEQTAVEFETEKEGDREEVEYELEFRTGTAKGIYTVERETVGNTAQIKVTYVIDGKQGEFRITSKDGKYTYVFSDGSTRVF